MMKKQSGFTLIELIIFIIVTGILASTLLLVFVMGFKNIPSMHYNFIAAQLADKCMEGFIGQRRLLGYSSANLACSASPPLPALCTTLTGYAVSATITCTPILDGDTVTSRTVTVSVTGLGTATLTSLIASY